ncbi:FAD-dependent oxidoreductase [Gordonia sp. GONU]|uniref:NAD(P)/FAD-dependent oxidoreductase n=1 Tax=Gordonia sp. GONU TaxID=2972949 RepID=UPI0021ACFA63|nr:FAD-dependent oxidoreductase [Gordonia sp. GONU]MCR8899338.1 FAD-dependent oxidoreductase [Gordonia sp. GONU]
MNSGPAHAPSVVIVGTGVAGITAAETLRANRFDGTITVFGEEPHLPYRRTALSKGILDGDLSDPKITLRPPGYWEERGIHIVPSVRVTGIDAVSRTVELADGSAVGYDALVLATGGTARQLPGASPDLLSLRTRRDVERLRARIDSGPVVIVGGGLIGLEIAAAVSSSEQRVDSAGQITVLEAAASLLSRVVPDSVAEAVAALHRDRGVRVVTDSRITAAETDAVTLADGTRLTGTVISAIGMQPDTALAEAAGLSVSPAGIVVDETLHTSTPRIYAAGDVAARPHPLTGEPMRAEQWLTATEHGKLVAMTIAADLGLATGPSTPVPRVPLAWSMQYSSNIQMVGWPTMADRFDVDLDTSTGTGTCADGFATTVRCFADERLVGAVCMGRGGAGRALRTEIEKTLEPVGAAG